MELETMTTLPLPQDKGELLARMAFAYDALEELLGALDEEGRSRPESASGWTVKDHLAHLAAWERGIVALLQKRPRYPAMNLDVDLATSGDFDAINDALYQQHRDRSWAEVEADWQETHQRMLYVLDGLNDADLFRTYSYYQPDEPGEDDGTPIMAWIASNTYQHYAEHMGWIKENMA